MNRNKNIKHFEGSVDVNGDKTPITRKPVEQIDSTKWNELSTAELHDIRTLIISRMNAVGNLPNGTSMHKQLQQGLNALEQLIATRQHDNIELI